MQGRMNRPETTAPVAPFGRKAAIGKGPGNV